MRRAIATTNTSESEPPSTATSRPNDPLLVLALAARTAAAATTSAAASTASKPILTTAAVPTTTTATTTTATYPPPLHYGGPEFPNLMDPALFPLWALLEAEAAQMQSQSPQQRQQQLALPLPPLPSSMPSPSVLDLLPPDSPAFASPLVIRRGSAPPLPSSTIGGGDDPMDLEVPVGLESSRRTAANNDGNGNASGSITLPLTRLKQLASHWSDDEEDGHHRDMAGSVENHTAAVDAADSVRVIREKDLDSNGRRRSFRSARDLAAASIGLDTTSSQQPTLSAGLLPFAQQQQQHHHLQQQQHLRLQLKRDASSPALDTTARKRKRSMRAAPPAAVSVLPHTVVPTTETMPPTPPPSGPHSRMPTPPSAPLSSMLSPTSFSFALAEPGVFMATQALASVSLFTPPGSSPVTSTIPMHAGMLPPPLGVMPSPPPPGMQSHTPPMLLPGGGEPPMGPRHGGLLSSTGVTLPYVRMHSFATGGFDGSSSLSSPSSSSSPYTTLGISSTVPLGPPGVESYHHQLRRFSTHQYSAGAAAQLPPIQFDFSGCSTPYGELMHLQHRRASYHEHPQHPQQQQKPLQPLLPRPLPQQPLSHEEQQHQVANDGLAVFVPLGYDPQAPDGSGGAGGGGGGAAGGGGADALEHAASGSSTSSAEGQQFPCNACGKVFTRSYNLKSHLKTHTAEKPYVCTHCSKGFARKQDCLRHERIHTNDRPFQCPRCLASFTRHDALTRHEFTCAVAAAAAMGPKGEAAAKAYAARLKARAGRRHSVFMQHVAEAAAATGTTPTSSTGSGTPAPDDQDRSAVAGSAATESQGGEGDRSESPQ